MATIRYCAVIYGGDTGANNNDKTIIFLARGGNYARHPVTPLGVKRGTAEPRLQCSPHSDEPDVTP